jgi:hypothetical protein
VDLLSGLVLGLGHLKLQLPHIVVLLLQLRSCQSLGWVSSTLMTLFLACKVTSPEEYQLLVRLADRAHAASIVKVLRETLTLSIELMLPRFCFKLPISVGFYVKLRNTGERVTSWVAS